MNQLTRRRVMQFAAGLAATSAVQRASAQERVPVAPPVSTEDAFRRVTLEVSLEPFHDPSPAGIRRTFEEIFRSWAPLLRRCSSSAIMLWSADGSEILEYRGNMDDAFDWARYLGDANPPTPPPGNDPGRQGTHGRHWLYIRSLRETGRQMTGKPVETGATFDPGGEFAVSDFKFHRHREIAKGTVRGPYEQADGGSRLVIRGMTGELNIAW